MRPLENRLIFINSRAEGPFAGINVPWLWQDVGGSTRIRGIMYLFSSVVCAAIIFNNSPARLPFVQLSEWVELKRMVKPHKHFILKSEKKKLPMAKPRSRCICYVAADAVAATSISKAAASATSAAQWPGAMATSAA